MSKEAIRIRIKASPTTLGWATDAGEGWYTVHWDDGFYTDYVQWRFSGTGRFDLEAVEE